MFILPCLLVVFVTLCKSSVYYCFSFQVLFVLLNFFLLKLAYSIVIMDVSVLTTAVCVHHWATHSDNLFWKKPNKSTWSLQPTTYISLLLHESCMRNNNILQFAVHKHILILLTFLYWANQSCNLSVSPQYHASSLKRSRIKAEYITRHFLRLEIRWIVWLNYEMQHDTRICLL